MVFKCTLPFFSLSFSLYASCYVLSFFRPLAKRCSPVPGLEDGMGWIRDGMGMGIDYRNWGKKGLLDYGLWER